MRKLFIAGNWKMNKTNSDTVKLLSDLKPRVSDAGEVDIMVAPPYTSLTLAAEILSGSNIMLGAQNMHHEESGAYTGEITADMLTEAGCSWVIIGHSERRKYFGCTDELVNKKLKKALQKGLNPIVCVGEQLEDREGGNTFEVLRRQVTKGLEGITDLVTIAYEPVWAIGTGKTASPEQADDAHKFIRELLADIYSPEDAEKIRILYGGSVKPGNVAELMAKENVDGGLIGGASLVAETFSQVVKF
ncbi:MAG: triose-phosphate isomerase [Elusimicrobia bacterium]|nr:triose-phosphate isomerase [Elusimicrobiota bacterium]